MDPERTLDNCETFLRLNWSLSDAVHALMDYGEWRAKDGFEPKDGDARARKCALIIIDRIARRFV